MNKPVCVVWSNDAKAFEQALAREQLLDNFEVHTLKLDETIADDLAERTEILATWRPGNYLQRMPRLRWLQTMTAGVDSWLESDDLPDSVTLTCARGSHRLSMPENILGVLFHLTKPFMPIVLDQRSRLEEEQEAREARATARGSAS